MIYFKFRFFPFFPFLFAVSRFHQPKKMIQSTRPSKVLLNKEKKKDNISRNDMVSIRFACIHCKIAKKEKDGHPSNSKFLNVNRYDTVRYGGMKNDRLL